MERKWHRSESLADPFKYCTAASILSNTQSDEFGSGDGRREREEEIFDRRDERGDDFES
jgi:hypothetical protein